MSKDFTTRSPEDRLSMSQIVEDGDPRRSQGTALGGSKELSSKVNTLLQSSSSLSPSTPATCTDESSSKDFTSQEREDLRTIVMDLVRRVQLLESRSLKDERQEYIARRVKERLHIAWEDVEADEEGFRVFEGRRQNFYYHVDRVALVLGLKVIRRGRNKIWAMEGADIKELLLPKRGRIKEIAIGPGELERYFDDLKTDAKNEGILVFRWLDKHHPDWNDDLRQHFFEQCEQKFFTDASDEFEQMQVRQEGKLVKIARFRFKGKRSGR